MKILKRVGQLKKVVLENGREIERGQPLFFLHNDELINAKTLPDDDHFVFEMIPLVTQEQLVRDYGGVLPKEMQGERFFCTCGSAAVMFLEGPYKDHLVCRMFVTTGYHQTSHTIKDGVIYFNKDTRLNRLEDEEKIIDKELIHRPKLK